MSKRESITRYSLIIKKLRRNPATFNEISEYLLLESELQEYNFNVSKRTFKRDIEDISALYNIDIVYDFSRKVYYVNFDEQSDINERMFEAFDTFSALNISDRLSDSIHFEKRRPQGTENLHGLLHAIKNKVQISFTYQKFWKDKITVRIVEPYALKEFKNRWYLMANDLKDKRVKSFALDRLSKLEITHKKIQLPHNFNVNEHFKFSFGIISPNGDVPQEVILSFKPFQGKYIKTLPLHESQVIITDNEQELRIKLNLHITHDFFMEVLSFGEHVKVIQPEKLILDLQNTCRNTLNLYK
jgi:predicted DNA-binding transcriptional regulator YafY